MKIRGNTVGNPSPRTDWNQTDPNMADYLKGRDALEMLIQNAQTAADEAQSSADKAQSSADKAQTAADKAQSTGNNALPKAGGSMTGDIAMSGKMITGLGTPTNDGDATNKKFVTELVNQKCKKSSTTVTLPTTGWSSKKQTVSATGVTTDNSVIVSPAEGSREAYIDAEVYCSAQGNGTLTFTCKDVPTVSLTVNILVIT